LLPFALHFCPLVLPHLSTSMFSFLPSFQASAAMLIRSALFWGITQRRVVKDYHSTLRNDPEECRFLFIGFNYYIFLFSVTSLSVCTP
jgi:hypothetical protein